MLPPRGSGARKATYEDSLNAEWRHEGVLLRNQWPDLAGMAFCKPHVFFDR